jgi:hypothetical protein
MGLPNISALSFGGNGVRPEANDNLESLKKTLQNPNTSTPEAMTALAKLYQLDGMKVADGTASYDEKNRYTLIEKLRSGNSTETDREQLASNLGMTNERLEEVHKRFQPKESEEPIK